MTQYTQNTGRKTDLANKIKSILDGDKAAFRDQTREFVTRYAAPDSGISMEEHREITIKNVIDMAENGYAQLPFPKEYGGKEQMQDYLHFVELLSHGDLSTMIKQGVNYGLWGMGVNMLGTEKHHKKYLNDIINGRLPGGFGMTELDGGSNVQGLQTTAIYDKDTDSFVINTPHEGAKKAYIGNTARHGLTMIVFAQLKMDKDAESEGVHAFIVPVRDPKTMKAMPGVTLEDHGHKVGLNGIDNGMLSFDNVSVPRENMLDRFATVDADGNYHSDIKNKNARFFKMISTLVMGRVVLSLSSNSVAKNVLTHAVNATSQREVFGSKLADLQATKTSLYPRLAESYAAHFMTRDLIKETEKGGSRELETEAAAAKANITDFVFETIDEVRKKMGGDGYIGKYNIGTQRDDIDIYRTFEGDNTVLRLLVAKNLLDDLKNEFKGASKIGQVKKGLSMKFNAMAAKYNVNKLNSSADHLLNTSTYGKLFELREETMRMNLGSKVSKLIKQTGDKVGSFNANQDEAMALADAHYQNVAIKKFIAVVDEQNDPQTKQALKDLCDLYAVNTIRKNAKWYLENGFISSCQSKALDDIQHDLYEKIHPHAQELVAAFAVPEGLQAPKPLANIKPAASQPANNNKKPPSKLAM